MGKIEEIQHQIKELEKKKQELQKELECEKQKAEIEYSFKNGEEYWVLWHDGYIRDYIWDGSDFDTARYYQGNVFKTKEEAEHESDRRALLTRFRQFRDKCNGDWKPGEDDEKHYIIISVDKLLFVATDVSLSSYPTFGYFKTEFDCLNAIDLFGDEIKRLWVEEK